MANAQKPLARVQIKNLLLRAYIGIK